jgi:hypothetical protein
MFQSLRGIVLITALTLNCGAAFAQKDLISANAMMPGCRIFASDNLDMPVKESLAFSVAKCAGLVEGIAYGGYGLGVCNAPEVTVGQLVRLVVKYIDARPERQHENFKLLALEALKAAFQCKR